MLENPSILAQYLADARRHKHKIAEPFVSGHVDGRAGRDLFELEPFGRLHHLGSHGPVQPFCFQSGGVVGEHFQKRRGEH